jgi:hypothetical protein
MDRNTVVSWKSRGGNGVELWTCTRQVSEAQSDHQAHPERWRIYRLKATSRYNLSGDDLVRIVAVALADNQTWREAPKGGLKVAEAKQRKNRGHGEGAIQQRSDGG